MARRYGYRGRSGGGYYRTMAGDQAARAGSISAEVTLDGILPVLPLHAKNAATRYGADFARDDHFGGPFFSDAKPTNVFEKMQSYRLSDDARALRDKLTDDLAMTHDRVKPRRARYQRSGRRVDVMRYERFAEGYSDDDRFWSKTVREEQPRRGTVVVHANLSMHAGESAASLQWTGATAWAIADMLEALGYRVILRAVCGATGNERDMHLAVTLKGADEPVSEHALAFLCDGGYMRVAWFRWMMAQDCECYPGLGSPCEYRGGLEADVIVPRGTRTLAAAEEFITDTMARFSGDAEDDQEGRLTA